jgi:membrane-associated phospholipid phosphatase
MRADKSLKNTAICTTAALLIYAVLTIFDFKINKAFGNLGEPSKGDLYYLFRTWGSLWPWILFSIALGLNSKGAKQTKTSIFLFLSPALGGALAEILKMTFRRERPSELGIYVFRSFTDRPWSTSGLGLPSSHTAVAFGGSMALLILFPRLRLPALAMAFGCALTRVASGAHYITDVYLGALAGSGAGLLLAHWLKVNGASLRHEQPSSGQS